MMAANAENLTKPAIWRSVVSRVRRLQDSLVGIGLQAVPGAEHGIRIAVSINLGDVIDPGRDRVQAAPPVLFCRRDLDSRFTFHPVPIQVDFHDLIPMLSNGGGARVMAAAYGDIGGRGGGPDGLGQ